METLLRLTTVLPVSQYLASIDELTISGMFLLNVLFIDYLLDSLQYVDEK